MILLFCKTYFIVQNQTMFVYTFQLEKRYPQHYYVLKIFNQNEEKHYTLTLSIDSTSLLFFENPNVEYPNTIIYN